MHFLLFLVVLLALPLFVWSEEGLAISSRLDDTGSSTEEKSDKTRWECQNDVLLALNKGYWKNDGVNDKNKEDLTYKDVLLALNRGYWKNDGVNDKNKEDLTWKDVTIANIVVVGIVLVAVCVYLYFAEKTVRLHEKERKERLEKEEKEIGKEEIEKVQRILNYLKDVAA